MELDRIVGAPPHGRNGYPTPVKGSNFFACTVWRSPVLRKERPAFLYVGRLLQRAANIRGLPWPVRRHLLRARDWMYRRGVRVFGPSEAAYTDVYLHLDDPLFEFRTPKNSPWLTAQECESINAPHRKKYCGKEKRTYAYDPDADAARRNASETLRREPLLRRLYESAAQPFETEVGGFLPTGASPEGLSPTAYDLSYRQTLRAEGKFGEADLVRRVTEGGSVEVRDIPAGTLWFFAE